MSVSGEWTVPTIGRTSAGPVPAPWPVVHMTCAVADPSSMEAKDGFVVDFAHQLEHIRNTVPFSDDEELDRNDLEVRCSSSQWKDIRYQWQ